MSKAAKRELIFWIVVVTIILFCAIAYWFLLGVGVNTPTGAVVV